MESSPQDFLPVPPPPPVDDAPLPVPPADFPAPPVDDAPLPVPPADFPAPPVDDAPLPAPPADFPAPPVDDAPLPAPPADFPAPPVDDAPLPAPPADFPAPPVDDAPLPAPPADFPAPPVDDAPILAPPADFPAPPASLPTVPMLRKELPKWILPATIILPVIGCGLSVFLHFQTEDFNEKIVGQEKQAEELQKNIKTLTAQIDQQKKQNAEVAQKREEQAQKEKAEAANLGKTLQTVQQQNERIRREYATLSESLKNAQTYIDQKNQEIIKLASGVAPQDTDTGKVGAHTVQAPEPLFPKSDATDKLVLDKSISYMKAHKSGNADVVSADFGTHCYHMGPDNKEINSEAYINKLKADWRKLPKRSYNLLKVAYSDFSIEIIYGYSYAGKKGAAERGYAKERWDYDSSGKIFYRQEIHSGMKEPSISENLRLAYPVNANK